MSPAERIESRPFAALKGRRRDSVAGAMLRTRFSSTNVHTSAVDTAAELWRMIMPMPTPITAASEVSTNPHAAAGARPEVSPMSMPLATALANPAMM